MEAANLKIKELTEENERLEKEISSWIDNYHKLQKIISVCRSVLSSLHYDWEYIVQKLDRETLIAYDSEYENEGKEDNY